jgi:hemerythrin
MTFMDWNDRFVLGVDAMDRQHRGLIASMNRLYDRNAAGAPAQELLTLIDNLAELTQLHFAE